MGPDYVSPQTLVPDAWHQQLEQGSHLSSSDLDRWWTLFNDEQLNELIDLASDGNKDLDIAFTRIAQARAQICVARADKWPNLNNDTSFQNFNGIAGIPGFSGARDLWRLQGNVSWEIDVFGQIHRQIQVADANYGARIEAYRDVLVTLYGDVAQTYVLVRTLQKQLEYTEQNVLIQKKALELARSRVEAGVAANLDEFQAESNLAATESDIPLLQFQLHQALNRMAVLIGNYPGSLHEFLAQPRPFPLVPEDLPMVLPCEMIRQRPDIRQAERGVAASTAQVGVAIADLYPKFSLGGNFGLQSQNFSTLFNSSSWTYGLGPSFTWALFQAGRIRCNIASSEAAVDEAMAIYEQTLLRAVEEIENAIVGFNKERDRREALQRTVDAAEASLESVLALYREGKTDFLNVLNTQRTLFLSQNALAISQGEILTQLITLYRALGGGWDPAHHCAQRLSQLPCPLRAPASIVENIQVEDTTARYFDLGTPDEESTGTDKKPRDGRDESFEGSDSADRNQQDGSDQGELMPPKLLPDAGATPADGILDRMLKELEDRLATPPPSE